MSDSKKDKEPIKLPSPEIQSITPAPEGFRNCTVCGLWQEGNALHAHEPGGPTDNTL